MRNQTIFALLLPLTCLLGCTMPSTPANQSAASSLAGNWQIQSGTAITSPPTGWYLVGALQGPNSTPSGIFDTVYSSVVSPTILSYTGTYNSSTGDLHLASQYILADLTVPANPNTIASGTLTTGCIVPGPNGVMCTAIAETTAVGVEVAPLNGTYAGTLTGTRNSYSQTTPTPITGTASVTFAQSTIANSSGQFPLTASVTFPISSGLDATQYQLSGTISGIGIILNYCSAAVIGPCISLIGYTNPTATQITVSKLSFADPGVGDINVDLSGTLTLQ